MDIFSFRIAKRLNIIALHVHNHMKYDIHFNYYNTHIQSINKSIA